MRHTLILGTSFDYSTNVTGIGIVVHEAENPSKVKNGVVVEKISEAYCGIGSGAGELVAIYRALQASVERSFTDVKLRSSFNQLRTSLKESYRSGEDFAREDPYGAVLRLSLEMDTVHFGYVPRRKNQMARRLAQKAAKERPPIGHGEICEVFGGGAIGDQLAQPAVSRPLFAAR